MGLEMARQCLNLSYSRDFQTDLNKNINKISILLMRYLNKKCDAESFKMHG